MEETTMTTIRRCPKYRQRAWFAIGLAACIACLTACRTAAPRLDYQALAHASIRLGVDIAMDDNHRLYTECASWIGVPYRSGGSSRRGTDCSGLVHEVFRKVYRADTPRSTADLRKAAVKVSKSGLREGDLVFFSSERSRKQVAHVGIYLKEGRFVHASTGKGVTVSRLDEAYYQRHWLGGGRLKETKRKR